jgi:hypothetical protein
LNNGKFRAVFDDDSGALRSFSGPSAHAPREGPLPYLESSLNIPFILERGRRKEKSRRGAGEGGEDGAVPAESDRAFSSAFEGFSSAKTGEGEALFSWTLPGDLLLRAELRLGGRGLSFRSSLENRGDGIAYSLEYPLIDGVSRFGAGLHQLIHPWAAGIEIDEPLENFEEDGGGLRFMPYPESFSGAAMQFFAYYMKGGPGLYIAALDGGGRQKWLNVYKQAGKLRFSHIYGYEDAESGKGLEQDWDVQLVPVEGARWESCAALYRSWALRQDWCERGTWAERAGKEGAGGFAKWLIEETGAVSFGIDASHDRSLWLERYRRDIGAPLFHILGPDWPRTDQNFYNSLPGGYDDWFPTRFNRENIACIRRQGDRFAPFEFDFLCAADKADAELVRKNLQVWPEAPKSVDSYRFNMLCPLTEYTRDLHVRRDERVVEESDCDALYYDISANNIIKTCMSADHGHPPGSGAAMTRAYRRIYRETKEAMAAKKGAYVPIGTEMINETLIGELDYYQARANGQPNAALEFWPIRKLIRQNRARVIPLFKYVYSEYAPLRCDGWGKFTRETGDLIYHTIAKTYLWGGVFEVNLEYSEAENIDGQSGRPEEHYYHFSPRGFAYDGGPAKFTGKCARLRLGPCGAPLVYGRMLEGPEIRCRKIYRAYYMYNHGIASGEQGDRGLILLDAVLGQAYRFKDREVLYLANTSLFHEEAEVFLARGGAGAWEALVNPGCPDERSLSPGPEEGMLRLRMAPLETMVLSRFVEPEEYQEENNEDVCTVFSGPCP